MEKWPVDQLLSWLEKCESKYIRVKSNDLSVLIAILKFCNNSSLECFPSIEKISRITLKEKRRVRDVIKRLVKLGILTVESRYNKDGDRDSNLYKYNPNMLWGVGAICTLRWVTNVTYGGVHLSPLTTNTTTDVTKKQKRFQNSQSKYVEQNTKSESLELWNPTVEEKVKYKLSGKKHVWIMREKFKHPGSSMDELSLKYELEDHNNGI